MATKTNSPLPVDVIAGTKYGWCNCGYSQNMPLCDHAHREFSDKKSFKFIAEESKTLYLCGCSETKTPPYCDGTNNCREL
ncbi:MAG: CDGSH iron-sulfur domain-containing protein [Methylococcaceae bacterium]|nr:CDGSH iron-sulfur domain-containing protein [Methylococcaceae bacterium]